MASKTGSPIVQYQGCKTMEEFLSIYMLLLYIAFIDLYEVNHAS